MQADSAQQQGLYRPEFDHDACGIGALADINGERHHQILDDALSILVNLEHRGGTGLSSTTSSCTKLAVCRSSRATAACSVAGRTSLYNFAASRTKIGRIIFPFFCRICAITLFSKRLELERQVSKCFLKSSNSAEIGDFMRDILSIHRYLSTKIVIKQLIRYFFVLLP